MYNLKSLELDLLITVSQQRRVPTHEFARLFEHNREFYEAAMNELVPEKLFEVRTIDDIPVYELTPKGKYRITELIEQRETEIAVRILHLKQEKPVPAPGWKTVMGLINSIAHAWMPSKKMTNKKGFFQST